ASRVLPAPLASAAGAFFPQGFDAEKTLTLVTPARARELGKRFAREADALYLEAKRAMVTTQNRVPAWVLALLVVLGWNEAMAILFNPLYLVLTALLVGTVFVLHSLRLWGPALRAVNGLASVANDHVHELLVEAVNRTEPARAARREPRAAEDIELEALGDESPVLSASGEERSSASSSKSQLHASRSILPAWYAESRFLFSEALRATSDSTDSFVFGRMFKTPSNPTYCQGNLVYITFCHLEFPWDCNGVLADPPKQLAAIIKRAYSYGRQQNEHSDYERRVRPRCLVDCTLKDHESTDAIVREFADDGFMCTRSHDAVMRLAVAGSAPSSVFAVSRLAGTDELPGLVACAARSLGYDQANNTEWLAPKLRVQLEHPEFSVFAIRDNGICAFLVLFVSDKARDLALVQVVGTLPECRRRGMATCLLQQAAGSLPSGTKVYLDAEKHMQGFYERLGFELVGNVESVECVLPE
ncbi:Dynamin-like GTPase that mediates homotypic ER fusion, partial [Coemansia sp. RSA 2708]